MLRPGLWRSSDEQSRDDAQDQIRVLDLRKTTPTTRHERKTDQEELELARDEHAVKGLAELRKQLRPSPNDLSVLFAPHLAHACTLVPNKPLRPLPFSHAKPWNENVQLESHRDEPSMQFGRPQKTSAARRARRVLPKRASSDQVSASWTSPAKTAVKRQRKTNATKNKTSEHQQPAIPSALQTLADLHEQEAVRLILLREGLLAQAQARLRGVRPISHETFVDQETLSRELARVSLLVVEVILRSRRVGCKAIDGANRECREIGYEWNGANYLLKMISDVGMLDQLNVTKASKFARNPLLLSHNLDELAKLIKVNVLEFQTATIWRFLDRPSTYEVRQYTAAIWILREEAHYERRQAPRMLEAMRNRVLPPDPAIVEAKCLQEAANKEMAVGGCWKYGGKPISSAAAVASPHARARSKVTFEKRIRILENVYKENCEAQVQKRENAARQMQKIVRSRLARRSILHEEKRRFVAVELQRFWRGGLARVDFAKRREQQADAVELAPVMETLNRRENAALRIQCLWRRAVATGRVQITREDTAATQVIAWFRCHAQRWRHKAFIAARRIQMMTRARFARNELARLRLEQKQNRAATKVQCIIRIWQARKVREGLVRDRAASRIQRRARIFVTYSLARKAVRAQIIIMSWRQHRARRLVRERRQFLRAVDLVQSWHRERSAARKAQLERQLASWRAKHTSVSRKFTSDTSNTKSWFQGCALYDHQRALQKQLGVLRRTSTARRALERLEARIAKYAARLDELNVTVSLAPMRAMLKVKARYEQMLVITKHLSSRELADAIDDATDELDAVEDRIEFIESLVRTAIKARDDFIIATRVTDAQEYVLCRSPTEFEAFNKAYLAAQRREQTLAEMQRKAEVAEARWKQMIIETEWKHRIRVETLEKASSETVSQLHKRSARAGAAQIALHIRTRGLAAAAERRAEVKRSVRIAEQLAGRISAMAEEDAYAEAHRAYLAAPPLAMRAARKHFDAFDVEESLHPGEITPEDFQKLAFDLGVVVPMARIRDFVDRVDLNGNNLIDWDEFARWYFCCSEADKLRFQFHRMGTRAGASQLFRAGGLSTKLRVDQASRKAKRLVRATTSHSLLLTSQKSSRKTSRKLLPR